MIGLAVISLLVVQTVDIPKPDPAKALDFWVGEWNLTGKSRVTPGKNEFRDTGGKNTIKKVMKGKVIHENFAMPGFAGQSWSVYQPNAKVWTQTWVDDTGAYLLFRGGQEGDKVILKQMNIPASAGHQNRMVFENITKNKFDWRWQRSMDGGKSWEDQWTVTYRRAGSK